MSRQQMFRLGRTLTVVDLPLWFINHWFHSFQVDVAILIIGLAALTLVWKGLSE